MGVRTGYKYDIINQVDMILYDFECLKIGKIPPQMSMFLRKNAYSPVDLGVSYSKQPPLGIPWQYHGINKDISWEYHRKITNNSDNGK